MPARYDPAHGPELIVQLWDEGKGFTLELCYPPPQRAPVDRLRGHPATARLASQLIFFCPLPCS
jgi:hypothetical protein